ncbi:peptide antibiotic resistance protein [Rhizobium sp. S152]|uniref:peptide antibiotic resistance protein n=1 Tax=Rhizobium sp. S152 TaxID=3055038 RepID=UPI0025A95BAC|nr:peptide antibiotic resistance protein [Rhizobium sp. S152]MDM9625519.1 peptide antibiotic resistance protein [Rhizobium sp. S152]
MLHLQTFGDLRMSDETGEAVRYPAKAVLMAAYLFTCREHELSRHELAEFLWADAEAELAGLNLRKLISRIRQVDGANDNVPFSITPTAIKLRVELLSVDLEIIDADTPALDKLKAIADLLRRDFAGSIRPATRLIEAWIERERHHHHLKLREALLAALPQAESAEDFRALSAAGLYLLEKDSGDEQIRAMLRELPGTNRVGDNLEPRSSATKHFARPQGPYEASTVGAGESSTPALPRMVLLPPTSDGNEAGLPLAGALIEDVTIELCALRNISIVAPHTAEQIRRDSDKSTVVGRYSISYLLDTRLSGEGLYAQLIYFPTDEIIWATRFSMTADTLPTQRRLIAQQLTASVVTELAKKEQQRLSWEASPQAYHSYLIGASLVGKLTLPHIRRARAAFKEALRYNGDFSPAFTGLSRTYTSEWLVTAQGNEELLRMAEQSAARAIERDEGSPGGFRELGVTKLYLGDVDGSVEALQLAEELSPHFADVIYSHADTLVHASRPADALAKIQKAMALNPISPDSYLWCAAGASYFLERYEEAMDYVGAMKDKAPAHRIAAASCAMLGDRKRAQLYRQRAEAVNPVFDVEKWLAVVPFKESWQKDLYREGLLKAGF